MKHISAIILAALAAAAPTAAVAQEADVTRRSYTFLGNQLDVAVRAEVPGVLHVIRGDRGRVEVAARTRDGFAGFGMSADPIRQLSLSAVGADAVQYLLVIPPAVAVRVRLPNGRTASPSLNGDAATYRWGDPPATDPVHTARPLQPTLANGLFLIHSSQFAPSAVQLPRLDHVRSVSVRVEGASFRIAASQPLPLRIGTGTVELGATASPADIVLYVPRASTHFSVFSATQRLIDVVAGEPRARCSGAVLQQPSPSQLWLSLYPGDGRTACR